MKAQYRIRNWSEYNAGLKKRGSLTFWMEESVLENWLMPSLSGKPGASLYYSNIAILAMATLKVVYRLAGRQCQGFLESIFQLMGVKLPVPDHSTLSRRLANLPIPLPIIPKAGPCHVVVDSTGVKVYGQGEWMSRQHGVSKRRTWLKLHLGIDESSGEILAAVVRSHDVADGSLLAHVLLKIEQPMWQVSADGAYDQRHCYHQIMSQGAMPVIPPRQNAVFWEANDDSTFPHPRDEHLRFIQQYGLKQWKQDTLYHRRSLAETTMFRLKTIFGERLMSRLFDNQISELYLKCAVLNHMIHLAKPDSYPVTA